MVSKKIAVLFYLFPLISWANQPKEDVCDNLLALINRPTASDSACAVKQGLALLEAGYQYQRLYPINGNDSNFPDAELRIGLPFSNELFILLPNEIILHTDYHQTFSGLTTSIIGVKHQFPLLPKWIYSAEAAVILPAGSDNFGNNGAGGVVNGIATYTITPAISAEFMFGVSSQTTAFNSGGQRYTSFNPDLTVSWQVSDKLQFYAEVYGQTQTGPGLGSGFNADSGVQYLLAKNIEIDAEYGHRINGLLDGFEQYVGVGGAWWF